MKLLSTEIKEFYSQLQFPGYYTASQINQYKIEIKNPYLKIIDQYCYGGSKVLDVGCGTGLITNMLATLYPGSHFTGLDFANSIEYAKEYAKQNKLRNTKFHCVDLTKFSSDHTYDIVICQGVLHHIPNVSDAVEAISQLVQDNGILIVSVYHPWGKLIKKVVNINYGNEILRKDQELVPYETAYHARQVQDFFKEFDLIDLYPRPKCLLNISALLNSKNGGLTTYVLKKHAD